MIFIIIEFLAALKGRKCASNDQKACLFIGYKNAQNLAAIKHSEQQKQKAFELASKEPLKQTFETNPLAQNNEKLFKKESGKKKRRKNRQDKYTNDM